MDGAERRMVFSAARSSSEICPRLNASTIWHSKERNTISSSIVVESGGSPICSPQRMRNCSSHSGLCRSSRTQRPRKSRNSLLMKSRLAAFIFITPKELISGDSTCHDILHYLNANEKALVTVNTILAVTSFHIIISLCNYIDKY